MKVSKIKRLSEDADWDRKTGEFHFKEAEQRLLKKFDQWRNKENLNILAMDFGRVRSMDMVGEHYCYIRVLYEQEKSLQRKK